MEVNLILMESILINQQFQELEKKHKQECFDDMIRNNIPITVEHLAKIINSFFDCDVKTSQIYEWLVSNNYYLEHRAWNRATRNSYILKYIPKDSLIESNKVIQKNADDYRLNTSFVLYIYLKLIKEFECNNT